MYSAEEKDDFHEFYQQYRPRNRSSLSPVENSNCTYPRSAFYGGCSETGTESLTETFSSGYSSGQTGFNRDGQLVRRRFPDAPRSRSQGRDFHRADLMSFYHSRPRTAESEQITNYANQVQASPEDTISRDSGHSSGGTPEFGRRSFVRYNSFPQPGQVTRAEVYNTQVINNDELVDEEFSYSKRRPLDSYSLYGSPPERVNRTNYDSMSLHSFDVHKRNLRYIEGGKARPKITARRNVAAPEQFRNTDVNKLQEKPRNDEQQIQRDNPSIGVRRYSNMFILAVILLLVLGVWLMVLTTYNKWKCSSEYSHTLNMDIFAKELSSKLIGQNLASSQVLTQLKTFSESEDNPVLVLILFGATGIGKTHTSNLISHMFPIQSNTHHIQDSSANPRQISEISGVISQSCGYSFVIVDDLDHDDKVIINRLEKMIVSVSNDSNSKSKGTLIVVTTPVGGENVNKFLLEISKDNLINRDKVTSEAILENLKEDDVEIPLHSTLVDYNIPVHLIPFLPLTRDHVRQCITNHLKDSNAQMHPKEVNSLLDRMLFFSQDFPIFSRTGCKQISTRVNVVAGGKHDL